MGEPKIVVKDLALLAKDAGHEVSILTFAPAKNHIVDEIITRGITLIQLPHTSHFSPINLFFLMKHFHEQCYDIIHSHMPLRQKYLVFINRLLSNKLPLITTEHVDQYKSLPKNPLYKWTYRQYKKVVLCSNDMRDYILRYLQI